MKKCCLIFFLLVMGTFLFPHPSSAYHSFNYYLVSQTENMCTHCHPGGPGAYIPECIECHTATAPPYSVDVAPTKETHSSAVIGSDKYGIWERECLDCHEPHHNNGITKSGGITDPSYMLVEFTGLCIETVNKETTMSISDLVINDPAWADPATWSEKTGTDRGLVLLDTINGSTFWYKVLSATSTSITFKNEHTYFPPGGFAKPQAMSLAYGQFIREEVSGSNVQFGGPATMAYDESGTGIDPTPNGICQVCHTQTAHWRSNGAEADHFSGWRCTLCHPHEEGFKPVSLTDPFHSTHIRGVKGDLGLQCTDCHSDQGSSGRISQPSEDVCLPCHSPDGAYDGLHDPEIGAYQESNWATTSGQESSIYDAYGNLRPGKEDWCLGCHDDGHSVILGVQASNIAGKTLTGTWQSPQGIVDTGLAGVENLIDGDISTGNNAGTLKELIFDLGSQTNITHIRLYNSGSRKYRLEVWASNDLNEWTRVQWGRKIMAAKPFWDILPAQQWFETRLDKLGSFRYVKLIKEVEKEVITGALREFQYKADLSYGYKVSGHKITCDNCHDTNSIHVDGIERTYKADLNNYSQGYRFADIILDSGEILPALEIPRVGTNWKDAPRTDNDFALCFSCHNKYDLLGDAYGEGDFLKNPLKTNFRDDENVDENGNPVNAHLRHLRGRGPYGNSPDWDSDWNDTPDSPQSCTACHNVHGSPNPVMTRHGELVSTRGTIDRVPMFNFQYKNMDGDIDPDLMNTMASSGGESQFFRAGPAKIERSHTCKMCHNDKKSYNRTAVSVPLP